jgi:hypothetical protein
MALFSVELASCFDQQHHGGPYKKNTVVHGSTGAGPTLARPSSKGKAFVAHQTKEVVAKGLIALAPLIPFEIIY